MVISTNNHDFLLAKDGNVFLLIDEEGVVVFKGTYQEILYWLDNQADERRELGE